MTTAPSASIAFRALDDVITVRSGSTDALRALRGIFQEFPTADAVSPQYLLDRSAENGWFVEAVHRRVCETRRLSEALRALEWQIFSDVIRRTAHLHLHGAALLAPSGQSVLVLGDSGVGKTTLTLALMGNGFLPFADDVTLVDSRPLAPLTFPRAFHMCTNTLKIVGELTSSVPMRTEGLPVGYALPLRWATRRAPVGTVLFPLLRVGNSPAAVRLSIAAAAVRLLQNCTTLHHDPQRALAFAARVTSVADCYAVTAGDLSATARLVQQIVADRDETVEARESVVPAQPPIEGGPALDRHDARDMLGWAAQSNAQYEDERASHARG